MHQLLTALRSLDQDEVHRIFFVAWACLAVVSLIVWQMSSPDMRRRWQPYGAVLAGVVFLAFAGWESWQRKQGSNFLFFVVPVVGFIMYSNARLQRVCANCGALNGANFFRPAAFCRNCGSALGD